MRQIISIALCAVMAGCATNPDKVSARYVSPVIYSNYDCDQLRQEMVRIGAKVDEVTGQQRSKARNDQIAMGVGMVVFWPAPFMLALGEDKKSELQGLKGQYDAVNEAAIMRKCGMPDEVRTATAAEPAMPEVTKAATQSTSAADGPQRCGMVRQKDGSMKRVPC